MSINWGSLLDPTTIFQTLIATAVVAALWSAARFALPRLWQWGRKNAHSYISMEYRKLQFVLRWYEAAPPNLRLEYQNYIAMRVDQERRSNYWHLPAVMFGLWVAQSDELSSPLSFAVWAMVAVALVLGLRATWRYARVEQLQRELFDRVEKATSLAAFRQAEKLPAPELTSEELPQ